MRSRIFAALLASWVPAASASAPHAHHRSPHVEITAVARIETVPRRVKHTNGREFEELDVRILSEKHDHDGLVIDRDHAVHVVHDLTCGGTWLEARPGDRVEIQGEYVHPPRGGDLIHFTHPASTGSCGSGAHPDGYFRAAPSEKESAVNTGQDLFQTTVRPVVARRCLIGPTMGQAPNSAL